jgi:GT2 family glycosyltransferase
MTLSVIICTFRRYDRLDWALASLERQVCTESSWEVLVVENDTSGNPTMEAVCEKHKVRLPLRHVIEGQIGLSHARNTGVRLARGEYAAFLDDDAEAAEGWLAALFESCRRWRPEFCGGPSLPLYRSPKPAWYLDCYATSYMYGDKARWLGKGEMLGGMNFVVARRTWNNLGGFNPKLGMTGYKMAYGEESDLLMRAWEANPNLQVWYHPAASVRHEMRAEKMTVGWQLRSAWAGGRSSVIFRPLYRTEAVGKFPKTVWRLLMTLRRRRGRPWQQWVWEELSSPVWNCSRQYHGLLRGNR